MRVKNTSLKLGIVRGGQLGRMLIQSAINYDIRPYVLDSDEDCPCRYLCSDFKKGNALDPQELFDFGKNLDVLTLEIEHVSIEGLKRLQAHGVKVYPDPTIVEMVQDKGCQKRFYKKHSIPTAPFVLINQKKELTTLKDFFPAVQKTRKAGYDGKGVCKINSLKDVALAFDEPSVVEKKINFQKEISVIVTRNLKGDMATFPVVELIFNPHKNLVDFLFAPAKISLKVHKQAVEIARHLAQDLKLVGCLAVEMFVLANGEVLVNEVAPRPHNSGHHTIEANITSQFDQHLRAIMGWPLGKTDLIKPAVMVNLLGEEGYEGVVCYEGLEKVLSLEDVYVHLYGKKKTKPYRKMGHVTLLDKSLEAAIKKARIVKKYLKVKA